MKISVIIPCYNEEKYIIEILKKVNNQKNKFDLQIIVSDDCSDDETIDSTDDGPIRIERNFSVLANGPTHTDSRSTRPPP